MAQNVGHFVYDRSIHRLDVIKIHLLNTTTCSEAIFYTGLINYMIMNTRFTI